MIQMNESRVTLRLATAADADTMHALIQAMAGEVGASDRVSSCPDDFRRYGFSGPPCFHALIAERAGAAVGLCVYFFSFSTWRGTRGVYVQDIYVAGSERGRGLAQRLIAETARRAGEQGARFLRLSVDRENLAARKFYEKLGIRHAADECTYMVLGDDFEALKNLG
jgi:ribosomal protein S18 acetylase RimI-like enzyme